MMSIFQDPYLVYEHTCMWCGHSACVIGAEDELEAYVCFSDNQMKRTKKDAPSDREYRWFPKVVETFERCNDWIPPTKEKIGRLKDLGIPDPMEMR